MIALFAVAHAEEEAAAADPVAPVVYTHPFYHHMAAPVYAHHPAVYHHAPVYTKAPGIVEFEEEDTMEEDAELETTLAPEVEETEEVATTEAPEEEEVVTEHVPVGVCKNEAGQLVPCAHGVAPGSAIYAYADAPGRLGRRRAP